jgi:pyruvate kinase
MEQKLPVGRFSKTKIVATIGPACESLECLASLITAGVDVFRLNMAHGERREHETRLATIRKAVEQTGQFVAVLADLAGPKIRLGELPGGQIDCRAGELVRFVRGTVVRQQLDLTTTYEPLVDELAVGDRVMLADGTVSLIVEERGTDFAKCRVVQPGLIRSRQGVNLPGVKLSISPLGPADRDNAVWAARSGIDFIGLSFVRAADDVHQLKSLLASPNPLPKDEGKLTAPNYSPQVIAKIEKPEALEHLEEIVAAADGVMVARGDLGVETDIAQVALVQKRIVAVCNRQHKPVIIATQMLDSMQHSSLPTRAEVTDVANAILDGADACMLSGETAIGDYPQQSVEMMHRIAMATEPILPHPSLQSCEAAKSSASNPITQAIVDAVGRIADQVGAKLIVVASSSGATALALSKERNFVPILGVSESEATLRRMCLYWGVFPLAGAPVGKSIELLKYVTKLGRQSGYLNPGDRVVLVTGTGLTASAHNAIVVHQLGDGD